MKKILSLFFAILFIFYSAQMMKTSTFSEMPTKKHNDWVAYRLKGKVKSVKETENNRVKEYSHPPVLLLFDDKGYLAEEIRYQFNGDLYERFVFQYDEKERTMEATLYDEKGKALTKTIYKYNDKDFEIEQKKYIREQCLWQRSISYGEEDDMVKAKVSYYTGEGSFEYSKNYFFYPDKLDKGFYTHLEESDRLKQCTIFDDKGNWTKKIVYNISDEVVITIIREITYYE